MKLRYVGEDPQTRFVAGWPAADHEERSAALARQKLDSGLYVEDVSGNARQTGKAVSRASQPQPEASVVPDAATPTEG